MRRRSILAGLALLTTVTAAACGKDPDLKASLQVVNVLTGYYTDTPTPDGQNKLVPSVTFQLKNTGADALQYVDLTVAFRAVGKNTDNESKQVAGVGRTSLDPGQTGDSITVRGDYGYTSPAAPEFFFSRPEYQGYLVRFFAQHHGRTTPLGELKVDSRVLPSVGRGGGRP